MSTTVQPDIRKIPISQIRDDGDTQPRAELDKTTVHDYAVLIHDGTEFPPVRVFFDGKDYWLSDGFHRLAAYKRLDREEIEAVVMQGSVRHARWDSFAANKAQGLRRTAEDRLRVAFRIFADDEWKTKSYREIADHIGIGKSRICELAQMYREQNGAAAGPSAGPSPVNKGVTKASLAAARNAPPGAGSHAVAAEKVEARASEDETSPPVPVQPSEVSGPDSPGATEDTDTMKAFNEGIQEVLVMLRQTYAKFAKLTRYTGKKGGSRFLSKWAQSYSSMGTLGVISTLARSLQEGSPAELSDRQPGYRTVGQVRASADRKRRA